MTIQSDFRNKVASQMAGSVASKPNFEASEADIQEFQKMLKQVDSTRDDQEKQGRKENKADKADKEDARNDKSDVVDLYRKAEMNPDTLVQGSISQQDLDGLSNQMQQTNMNMFQIQSADMKVNQLEASSMLEKIEKVVELIKISRSQEAGSLEKAEVKITVKPDLLQRTEIVMNMSDKGQVRVSMNAADIRSVQTLNFFKEEIQTRLGDGYQILVNDHTMMDMGSNSEHESQTKQEYQEEFHA